VLRIKVDEDLPRAIAVMFRSAGHDAATVPEQGLAGWDDEKLWQKLQEEKRLLITADVALADARKHPPGSHAGIVLLRLDDETRMSYRQLAKQLLESNRLEEIPSSITVVTVNRIRIRVDRKR
jgi:predicted nuclease of predicted toxin-antitoxin system